MKRVAIALLAIAIVPSLGASACNWRVERDPAVLVQIIPADPPTLNPVLSVELSGYTIASHVYESLIERDNETLEFIPKLALRWEIADDHLTYTFWLRKDVKWHDGAPFTADDVVYTFEKIRDPKVDAAKIRNYFRDIVNIEKVGDDAVRFTYARPYFKALEILGGAKILPRHIFDDGGDFNANAANRKPIGTGPYRFVGWETGRSVALSRFDGYWGTKPAIAGVVFRIIPDQVSAFMLLKKGAIDLGELSAIQWSRQTESETFAKNFSKFRYYTPNYAYIGWNMRRPFFADRRVRIAMTMLVNRKDILDKAFFGQGEVVANNFYRFGPYYDESIVPYPYDPAMARRLLDEAGWIDHDGDGIRDRDGVPFKFTLLMTSGSRIGKSIGLFLREELFKAGIDMEVQALEWGTMLSLITERNFDATVLGWATPFDDDPYSAWHSSQAAKGSNLVGFKNERADSILDEARAEFDRTARADLYRELGRILHDEQPYTFLFTFPTLKAVARRFTDVKVYKLGMDSTEWKVAPWPVLYEW